MAANGERVKDGNEKKTINKTNKNTGKNIVLLKIELMVQTLHIVKTKTSMFGVECL